MALCALLVATLLLQPAAAGFFSGRSRSRSSHRRRERRHVADISPVEVEEHQEKWADGIIALGRLLERESTSLSRVRKEAENFVVGMYGRDFTNVVVKPTGVLHKPFRNTIRGVVSWLVGKDPEYPKDEGFAAKRWRRIEFRNAGITLSGGQALAMGHAYFSRESERESGEREREPVKTEYTMGFTRDDDNRLVMNMHFSSLPSLNETRGIRRESITEDDIKSAQKRFVNGVRLLDPRRRRYREEVEIFVDLVFAFKEGNVLFKPPDQEEETWRSSKEGIYSYFAGYFEDYPSRYSGDRGFAREGFLHGVFTNAGMILLGEEAWAMGSYEFFREEGSRYEALFTIGYRRDRLGQLKMNLFAASPPEEVEPRRPRYSRECKGQRDEEVERSEVQEAQLAWAEGLIEIGSTYSMKGDYKTRAEQFVDHMYSYQTRPVLWKPPDTDRFRTSRAGAVSYLIGGDHDFPKDRGFALKGWEHVHFTNVDEIYGEGEVITMGYVSYAGSNGIWRTAEVAMGFIEDSAGTLKINMQHASFPDGARALERAKKESEDEEEGFSEYHRRLTKGQVEAAQEELGHWLVRIGDAHRNWTRAHDLAEQMVDELYDFAGGQVLFKVIEAVNATRFRFTRRGALSFFVGGDCIFQVDRGFAVDRPWSEVRFKNHGFEVTESGRANIFGRTYFCCTSGGNDLEVDHVMGYVADADGTLRIFLHDLSMPYEEDASWSGAAFRGMSNFVYTVSRGSSSPEEGGGGGGAGIALAVVAGVVIVGLFSYFACCFSGMGKGMSSMGSMGSSWGGGGAADYGGYDDDLGIDVSGFNYQRPVGGRQGGYSRAAGAGGYGRSAAQQYSGGYGNQYEQVQPPRGISGVSGTSGGSFYPQQLASRRAVVPSFHGHRNWQSAAPQRVYSG